MPRAPTTSDPFNAIAEPRRREILELLDGHERAVGDIADTLGMGQPSVSKHLHVLLEVGLVDVRREGRLAFYRTNAGQLRAIHEWTKRFERHWMQQILRIKARAERNSAARDTPPTTLQRTGLMTTANMPQDDRALQLEVQTRVHASLEETFDALLEELGPSNLGYADAPMPMVLEAWPGGRWYRDLGNDNGHWWGNVQAIRRPNLLEICGPMMMSFGVASNIQYRLTSDGNDTVLTFKHSALGLFPDGYRDALTQGWSGIARRIQARFART